VLESDITEEQQAADAVERKVAGLGRPDTLINDAGVMLHGLAVGPPLPEWQQMVELNVLGLLFCAHAALPPSALRRRDRPAPRRRHGERQLGGGPRGAHRQRCL
jgi:NADP-dependent 3-hydroxy acid dehydrogenase YdfG